MRAVGVKFSESGKKYIFNSLDLDVKEKDYVIVETEKGIQYGFVVSVNTEYDESKLVNIKNVLRIATYDDKITYEKNINDSNIALCEIKKIVEEKKLNMNIIDAFYTFDRKQLIFNFTSDERIDFRELAKILAQKYKTRIELHQIGIRDKAKMIGGIGPCGRPICCSTFLKDINSVTINMAKNQLLALNPTKVNGICGRLLCCLKYEDDVYTDIKKKLPKIGEKIACDGQNGTVVEINVMKELVYIEDKDKNRIQVDFKNGNNK